MDISRHTDALRRLEGHLRAVRNAAPAEIGVAVTPLQTECDIAATLITCLHRSMERLEGLRALATYRREAVESAQLPLSAYLEAAEGESLEVARPPHLADDGSARR